MYITTNFDQGVLGILALNINDKIKTLKRIAWLLSQSTEQPTRSCFWKSIARKEKVYNKRELDILNIY
jgi:hypothetical protein